MRIYIDRLKELMGELTHNEFFTKRFLEETERLHKVEGKLIVSEIDDTLFSRTKMRENEELLKNNPENAINRLVKFQLGVPYIIANYYEGKEYSKDITNLLSPNNSVILTTGFEEIQLLKLQALGLSNLPLVVLKENKEKIIALIQYVLYTLTYIPSEIIVYDNEIGYYSQYKELIEGILSCKLTIIEVTLDENNIYKKIETVS